MVLSKKLTPLGKAQYIQICEKIWGCVPVDVDWAISTNIYQQQLKP